MSSKNQAAIVQRRTFIGGSDARIIMGNDEDALLRLWQEKRGEVEPKDLSGNLIVHLGVVTEPLNRHWFQRHNGHQEVQRWIAGRGGWGAELINPEKSMVAIGGGGAALLRLTEEENAARLFLLWTARLSKPEAFPAPVFIDEFDPSSLQSGSDSFDGSQGNFSPAFLEVDDRREPSVSRARKLRLRDFQ